jgi:hypothetical protein
MPRDHDASSPTYFQRATAEATETAKIKNLGGEKTLTLAAKISHADGIAWILVSGQMSVAMWM